LDFVYLESKSQPALSEFQKANFALRLGHLVGRRYAFVRSSSVFDASAFRAGRPQVRVALFLRFTDCPGAPGRIDSMKGIIAQRGPGVSSAQPSVWRSFRQTKSTLRGGRLFQGG